MLERLRARFDPRLIRTRKQGGVELQYVDIASVIGRFLDELGLDWDWAVTESRLICLEGGKFLGTVTGEITVFFEDDLGERHGITRAGVGADVANDADKAYKTALAEAFKKAAVYFGVGLELWDEDIRTQNETVLKATKSDDVADLKAGVFELALIGGASPTAESVAAYFEVTVEDLQDPVILRSLMLGRAA
jgi:hypothetical protein